ncbi:MAG: NAD(P)/FAD-dependent oxidoreductase [Cyanobacteria bacterium HKST-UBA03]|nr:NAD(P)/FAD-dependent oxidoreductase [Cyanobacteria bacterium HKST-UBA03]
MPNHSCPPSQKHVPSPTLVVVGGGAAGFFGALAAKQHHPELTIAILEATARPLGKVKISGGGRCNVTNACRDHRDFAAHYPRGQKALIGMLARFDAADTVAWFEQRRVRLKIEADGRLFPDTDDSQTIIDCLLAEAKRLGITVHTNTKVTRLTKTTDGFCVATNHGPFNASAVLLACGAHRPAYDWLSALGHAMVPPVPSLFTFVVNDPRLAGLAGISVPDAMVSVVVADQKQPLKAEGPLLITHWGFSGPAVLKCSAWGARSLHQTHYKAQLTVDMVPRLGFGEVEAAMAEHRQTHEKGLVINYPLQTTAHPPLAKRLWAALCRHGAGITETQRWGTLSKKQTTRLIETLKRSQWQIDGKGVFKEEFVTAGGTALAELDLATMESRHVPGLYVAGELIDVDGLTGGFNFQNAWTTGYLAGTAIANRFEKEKR